MHGYMALPRLERLLGLADGSLTKEIELTQALLDLFIEYQIPSDLLAFDGVQATATAAQRIRAVTAHVAAIHAIIEGQKREQLEEARKQRELEEAERREREERARREEDERKRREARQRGPRSAERGARTPRRCEGATAVR